MRVFGPDDILRSLPILNAGPRGRPASPPEIRPLDTRSLYMNAPFAGKDGERRFALLCEGLRADLYRFAFWLARDRQIADDVVQEALLRAWRSRDKLQEEGLAKPWLLTIVRREHAPQRMIGALPAMLALARELEGRYTLLYNGPRAGASAPDHLHMQALPVGSLPFEDALWGPLNP